MIRTCKWKLYRYEERTLTYSFPSRVTEENVETTGTQRVVRQPPGPQQSAVHGREVHVNKQKQTQVENRGDLEITRKITATETTEMEHKGNTQERVIDGPVLPSNPPVFTKKIQPCRVFENEQARFEVEFDGDPLPKVKWFREDFQISNSKDFQIHTFSTKSILIIRNVFPEDSAIFSCIAENRGGTAKCSANLIVEERKRQSRGGVIPPSFLQTAQDVAVKAGQLARFDTRITGTKPIDVYWLLNGNRVTPSVRAKVLEEDNVYTLLIIEAGPEDTGKYECVAVNNGGEARCEAECIIQSQQRPIKDSPMTPGNEKAPTIIEELKSQSILEGRQVIFKTRVIGKPIPVAKWFKGENIIKQSKYFKMTREGDYYTLRISEAFPEDEGVYKCVIVNNIGEATTSATLKVNATEQQDALPTLTPLKDVICEEGMPAQFHTKISGKSKPLAVQWYREGALIPQSPDFQVIKIFYFYILIYLMNDYLKNLNLNLNLQLNMQVPQRSNKFLSSLPIFRWSTKATTPLCS